MAYSHLGPRLDPICFRVQDLIFHARFILAPSSSRGWSGATVLSELAASDVLLGRHLLFEHYGSQIERLLWQELTVFLMRTFFGAASLLQACVTSFLFDELGLEKLLVLAIGFIFFDQLVELVGVSHLLGKGLSRRGGILTHGRLLDVAVAHICVQVFVVHLFFLGRHFLLLILNDLGDLSRLRAHAAISRESVFPGQVLGA